MVSSSDESEGILTGIAAKRPPKKEKKGSFSSSKTTSMGTSSSGDAAPPRKGKKMDKKKKAASNSGRVAAASNSEKMDTAPPNKKKKDKKRKVPSKSSSKAAAVSNSEKMDSAPLKKKKKKKVPAASTSEKMDTAPRPLKKKDKKRRVDEDDDSSSTDDENIIQTKKKKAKPSSAKETKKKVKPSSAKDTKEKAKSSSAKDTKKEQKSKAAVAPSDNIKEEWESYDYSSDEYDSDQDRKESGRIVVQPTTLSPEDDIGDEVKGKLRLIIKTLLGERHLVTASPTDDVAVLRQIYWDLHQEWKGEPHKAINFINNRTHHFLDEHRTLSELGVVDGTTLLLVIGSSSRHTGGWPGPYGNLNPPRPHENIYRVSDRFNNPVPHAPPAAAAGPPAPPAAAAPPAANPPDDDSAAATANAPNDEEPERKTAQIPGSFEVHAVVNTPGGDTSVDGNSITHDGSLGVTYFVSGDTPSEFTDAMDAVESHLPSSTNVNDLPFRLNSVKIGQSGDLAGAIKKVRTIRSHHPHIYLRGVFLLHGEDKGPEVLERALHICNSLKRGQSHGEWFGRYSQLDKFQFIELGENLNGATLIYFSTISFASRQTGDLENEHEKKGVLYRVFKLWGDQDKQILKCCIDNHGGLCAFYPFRYDMARVSFRQYCTILLYAVKIGRYSEDNIYPLERYLQNKILYANGFISGVGFTTTDSDAVRQDERNAHDELYGHHLHVNGEYYLPPEGVPLSPQTAALFNGPVATRVRALKHIHETSLNLHGYVRSDYMTFRILWECFKEGAIILDKKEGRRSHDNRNWESVGKGEKLMSRLPAHVLDTLMLHTKVHQFGSRASEASKTATTVLDQDIHYARNDKNIIVKTATCDFRRPSLSDARRDFIDVFGKPCYDRVSESE